MIVGVGLVGAGSMGANHARVISRLQNARLAAIVDDDEARARELAGRYGCYWSTKLDDLPSKADAAIVAVPTPSHASTAMALLEAGLDVLVEKPLAADVAEGRSIVEAAEKHGRILAVGHVERFNPVSLELTRLVRDPIFVAARRMSSFSPRVTDSVVKDLMIHDADLVLALAPKDPIVAVHCEGAAVRSDTHDVAVATIVFESGLIAQLTASRVSQEKVRQIEIIQRDCTISADLLRQDLTIRKQTQVEFVDDVVTRLRETTVSEIPYLDRYGEPLQLELEDFVDAVSARRAPLVDGTAGLRALSLVERLSGRAE